jgi:hypothetical protein
MSRIGQLPAGLLALVLVAAWASPVAAQGKKVVLIHKWSGSVEDEALLKDFPKSRLITDQKTFERVWTSWKVGPKMPTLDFGKEIVLVAVSRGGILAHTATLLDGNLRVVSRASRAIRPGFRYSILVVSKEGVKSIDGQPLDGKKE